MAVTTTPLSSPFTNAIVFDADANEVAENNVRGGASTVFMLRIDNSANAAASYVKLYNDAAPTVGTTAPDLIIPVAANASVEWVSLTGFAFATALSFACVTTGGTGGTTGPTSDVGVRILCS